MFSTLSEKIKRDISEILHKKWQINTENSWESFRVEIPPEKKFGFFSTNVAMTYAKILKQSPVKIAGALKTELECVDYIDKVVIDGPGFINLFLKRGFLHQELSEILQGRYASEMSLVPKERIQVEFVSANPTGPLTIGHGRQAVMGAVLSSVFQKAGLEVTREYYFNDGGNQMKLLAASLWVRYNELFDCKKAIPEGGYHGEYLIDIAKKLREEVGDQYQERWDEAIEEVFLQYAKKEMFTSIKQTLDKIGLTFDVFYSENSLFLDGTVSEVIDRLKRKNAVYEKDGAVWFKASAFIDEEDKVLIRSGGMATYFLTDIAYHYKKYQRGFAKVYDIWGADHHGHIPRMKAAMKALDIPDDFFNVILHQMVSVKQNDEIVKMSKRAGNFITLDDLLQQAGNDAVRYFFAMVDKDSHLEFNVDLATSQTMENPVYYIQYAYARIHSLFENAKSKGIVFRSNQDLEQLQETEELFLIRDLCLLPEVLKEVMVSQQVHRLTNYLYNLAYSFHNFYTAHVFVDTSDVGKTNARLNLAFAFQKTIACVLELLGIKAVESMSKNEK